MSVSIATSISDELSESLSKLASTMERSKRYLISKAIEKFVEDNLEDEVDILLGNRALEREGESSGEYITLEEAMQIADELRATEGRNV